MTEKEIIDFYNDWMTSTDEISNRKGQARSKNS